MATTSTTAPTGVTLTDPTLFRQACYIDGAWVNARSNATINVDNPATGEIVGTVPKLGAAETRDAIEAAERALPAWRKKTAKERAAVLRKWFDLMLQHQDDLAQADDRGAGQAARRVERRGGLRRGVPRMVRRGGQARLRRHHSRATSPTSASSRSSSRLAWWPASRRGTSRWR